MSSVASDSVSKIPDLGTYLSDASALGKSTGTKQLVQIVVYDLPDRDCAAKASNGEFSIANNGQANYYSYIDQIVAQVQSEFDASPCTGDPDSDIALQSSLTFASWLSLSPIRSPTWSPT